MQYTSPINACLKQRCLATVLLPLVLSACTSASAPSPITQAVPTTRQLAVYPSQGQSPEKLSYDRYDCHRWAVQQSSFDPATMSSNNAQESVNTAPGEGTATGAVLGGITGAVVSGPHHGAEGALVGAVLGAAVGVAADSQQAHEANARNAGRLAEQRQAEDGYRHALEACLVGRGYSVR